MQNPLIIMLDMQDQMNAQVHPHWRDQHFEWYRALWLECGELIDHYGYKWWKKQAADLPQVQLEVVDIWHFGLSMLIDGRASADIAADIAAEIDAYDAPALGVLEAAEELAAFVLSRREFCVTRFWTLLLATGLSFDELYRHYVGKNVLNRFRQDRGYQQGQYEKNWGGQEDNIHLLALAAQIDCTASDFAGQLYGALSKRYDTLVTAAR